MADADCRNLVDFGSRAADQVHSSTEGYRSQKGKQYAEKNPTQASSTQLALQKRMTFIQGSFAEAWHKTM